VKFALFGLHRGTSIQPDTMVREAKLAEEAGFEAIWVGDHVALPRDLGDAAQVPRLEALVALSYMAAVTTRVRLGAGVIVLPQRQPVLLAKQLTSIDVLSKGRLTVGIGVGYVDAELRALGASLADRGARTDEYLAALHALWQEPGPAFEGRFLSFEDVIQRPLPVQRPHPPIVIGGDSPAAFRRAVTSGNGWYGWQLGIDETAQALAALRDATDRHERPAGLGALEITITPPGPLDLNTARRYAELGVNRLALQPQRLDDTAMPELITKAGNELIGHI
jgi:probable F420-dependent oxidoreductase